MNISIATPCHTTMTSAAYKIALAIDLDVTDESSVAAAVSVTREIISSDNKQLWCVVNNAATLVFADAEWQSIEMARKQLEVNTLGPFAVRINA